jgi:hypothetical protein
MSENCHETKLPSVSFGRWKMLHCRSNCNIHKTAPADGVLFDPSETTGESLMEHNHVFALEAKHALLDQKIHQEEQRPYPDQLTLSRLKKKKLRIKEVLATA